jgi:hypothetical protein
MPAVTNKRLKTAALLLVIDTALLLIIGAAMWHEAPSTADAAVGKGLVALGTALAIPAFTIVWAYLESRTAVTPMQEPTRNDWEIV